MTRHSGKGTTIEIVLKKQWLPGVREKKDK
jgi:hypothetical protein